MTRSPSPMHSILRRPLLLLATLLALVIVIDLTLDATRSTHFGVFVIAAGLIGVLVGTQLWITSASLRRARNNLAEEHDRLELMFSAAPIGMALVARDGTWVDINPAFCRMLGYERQELIGRQFVEFTHPDDRESNGTSFKPDTASRETIEVEKRYVARDGIVIWAQLTISPMTSWNGAADLRIAQVRDITSHKLAELALDKERELLTAFLENTPDQVYFKDLHSRFIRVSDTQARRLGCASPDELVGKTDHDVFSAEHAEEAYADEQRIIQTGVPIHDLEELETFPDGREAWVSTAKLPLRDRDGRIIGTFGVSRDVTARKLAERLLRDSEERWRTLLANIREMVILINGDGLITYASPSVGHWLGHDPESLVGQHLGGRSPGEDARALWQAFESTKPGQSINLIHQVTAASGDIHTIESTLICLRDDPAIGGVLLTSRDVSERVALENERERLELERRVSQRLEAVGQLSAGIAHEINTPLQYTNDSIRFVREAVEDLMRLTAVYHELLHTTAQIDREERQRRAVAAEQEADLEYLVERIPKAFQRTVEGIDRVTSIVQAMKRFSHPSGSKMAAANLEEAIRTTLEVCRNEYKYVAAISLEFGDLPPVYCAIGELNQVFLNLIINAAQAIEESQGGAAGERSGKIAITTRVEGDDAVIEISDNGPGIPRELMDRIYEPFFTTKEVGRGSGQGLALARATMEHHSGSIACASRPGEGTTFTLRLPIGAVEEQLAA